MSAATFSGTQTSAAGFAFGPGQQACTVEPGAGLSCRVRVTPGAPVEHIRVDSDDEPTRDAHWTALDVGDELVIGEGQRVLFRPWRAGGAGITLEWSGERLKRLAQYTGRARRAAVTDPVRLDFPGSAVEILDDRVVVVPPRDRLAELRAFVAALELGLVDAGVPAAGQGPMSDEVSLGAHRVAEIAPGSGYQTPGGHGGEVRKPSRFVEVPGGPLPDAKGTCGDATPRNRNPADGWT